MPAARPGEQEDGLGALIGLEDISTGPERATARVAVTDRVRQIHGIVHGGVYGVIAESICSQATGEAVAADGMIATAQANQASFLRPIFEGAINAEARVRHRGRTTWVWDCEFSDDDGRLCALVRMTVAVRPRPE
ncbi:MAG: PaaI family thioesterase [Solirubrobacterales bacterium]